MRFAIYQESRIGKRSNNEDRLAYCYSRDALLMVVADGMGGHYYGEVASQIAVQYLTAAFEKEALPTLADPFLFLHRTLTNAHHAIVDWWTENRLAESPRTTCVACVVQNNVAYWAHVGDSRLYHFRNGRMLSHTRDHSRVRLMIDQGMITEDEALHHPERNKVYTCLGGSQLPEIEFSRKTTLEAGDVLALCSDGVWGVMEDAQMARTLSGQGQDPNSAVPPLMDEAELNGGPHGDNLSLIAVRWDDNYEPPGYSGSSISTHTMAADEVATLMEEFGRKDSQHDDLSDDEIEKAIAEIRSAIRKYSK